MIELKINREKAISEFSDVELMQYAVDLFTARNRLGKEMEKVTEDMEEVKDE